MQFIFFPKILLTDSPRLRANSLRAPTDDILLRRSNSLRQGLCLGHGLGSRRPSTASSVIAHEEIGLPTISTSAPSPQSTSPLTTNRVQHHSHHQNNNANNNNVINSQSAITLPPPPQRPNRLAVNGAINVEVTPPPDNIAGEMDNSNNEQQTATNNNAAAGSGPQKTPTLQGTIV